MRRLLNFFRSKSLDADIREELDFHRSQSRGSFGNVTLIQERVRDASTFIWLESWFQDVRYGLRQLKRTPVLVAIAVLSLALGIGANTAVFTLIDAVMRQRLPVRDPGRLVLFNDDIGTGVFSGSGFHGDIFSYAFWQYERLHSDSFESVCAFRQSTDHAVMHVAGSPDSGPRESAWVHLVSGNYFGVLGVPAAAGRVLSDADDMPAAPRVAILSYGFWRSRFNRDPGISGKIVILNGTAFSIIGVATPEFFGERIESAPDFWVPLARYAEIAKSEPLLYARDRYWLNMMGRLKPGATMRSAEAAVNLRLRRFFIEQTGSKLTPAMRREVENAHVELKPGGRGISGLRFRYSEPLHLLMAVVAVVLLIACANIATLLLARASARQREFLARLALGASRTRLIRQVLTESVLLALLSAIVGTMFAWWSVKLLVVWMHINPVVAVKPNGSVLAFTMVVSILTGIAFGIVPAVRCSGLELRPGAPVRRPGSNSAGALIVLQVSLSLVLLLSSALLAHSLSAMVQQDLGFTRQHILLVGTDPRLADYQGKDLFPLYREMDGRMNAIPGVSSASVAQFSPISGNSSSNNFSIEGYHPAAWSDLKVYTVEVGPRFFETLGTPILFGRGIGVRDTPATPSIAVVNETFAKKYFPGQNPLGRKISLGDPFQPPGAEIVGVAKDSKYYNLRDEPKPMAFYPLWQPRHGEYTFAHEILLRTSPEAATVAPQVRRVLHQISSKLPVLEVTTLQEQIDHSMEQQRLITSLCSLLGMAAVVLASIGIYGTVAYSIARRTSEIGIRMAVGAQRRDVLWMVLRDVVVLIGAGLILGLPVALAGARWIKSFLYGVSTSDPLAIGTAVLLILLLASVAAYLPARRATKIDPLSALKYE